ncbi:MAG: helix-turn-helix transcriptional regulator [Stappiaceae bacterium]
MNVSQCKMARAALGWGIRDLAKYSGVAVSTISRYEAGENINLRSYEALMNAIDVAGIQFIPENGGGAGVRFKDRDQGL